MWGKSRSFVRSKVQGQTTQCGRHRVHNPILLAVSVKVVLIRARVYVAQEYYVQGAILATDCS